MKVEIDDIPGEQGIIEEHNICEVGELSKGARDCTITSFNAQGRKTV